MLRIMSPNHVIVQWWWNLLGQMGLSNFPGHNKMYGELGMIKTSEWLHEAPSPLYSAANIV